ncbi:hypothetical protein G7046_g689 [Stylonectria norvegica]|nr:hypothetical protein G7046_g689 [Stylonectria norvegica]
MKPSERHPGTIEVGRTERVADHLLVIASMLGAMGMDIWADMVRRRGGARGRAKTRHGGGDLMRATHDVAQYWRLSVLCIEMFLIHRLGVLTDYLVRAAVTPVLLGSTKIFGEEQGYEQERGGRGGLLSPGAANTSRDPDCQKGSQDTGRITAGAKIAWHEKPKPIMASWPHGVGSSGCAELPDAVSIMETRHVAFTDG